jgi:hypothetical protein
MFTCQILNKCSCCRSFIVLNICTNEINECAFIYFVCKVYKGLGLSFLSSNNTVISAFSLKYILAVPSLSFHS